MIVLSSCYFCGAASDARVEEYRLMSSPSDATSSESAAVSLCHSCRHKIETVVTAVTDETVEFVSTETAETDGDDEIVDSSSGSDAVAGEWISEPAAETEPESDDPPEVTFDSVPESSTDGSSGVTVEDPQEESGAAPEEEVDGEPSQTTEPEPSQTTEPDPSQTTEPEPEQEVSPIERPTTETYNRVVRLLQNREFPLDRTEFVDLATDAYGLGHTEVDQVLDYAISQGALAEGDGQLRRPE